MMADDASSDLLLLTTEIVSAHVAHNRVGTSEVPTLVKSVHAALATLGKPQEAESVQESPQGAVGVRKSLADPNKIISMIDGRPYSSLTRHLKAHGYTPESYREAFGLRADYPMVAAGYAEMRRSIAKVIGLGRRAGQKVAETAKAIEHEVEEVVTPKRRGRKPRTLTAALDASKQHIKAE